MAAAAAGRGRRARTVLDLLAALCAAVSLLSEWTVAIPPAHMPETFGYQTPVCWLTLAAIAAALVLDARRAVVAVLFAETLLAAWFGWATWVVNTPRFMALPFPFMPTDVIGSGFYVAGAAMVAAAVAVVAELRRLRLPVGGDLWLLTAVPGAGLMRLGRWLRGLTLCVLVCGAFFLASADSPDSTQFVEYGRFGTVPPAYPRAAGWVLLAVAAALFAISVVLTVRQRRELQMDVNSR